MFRSRVTTPMLVEELSTPMKAATLFSEAKSFSLTTRQTLEVQLILTAAKATSSAMFRSRVTTPMLVEELSTPMKAATLFSEAKSFSLTTRQTLEVQLILTAA
ncbi:unnamed protein product, partial [Ascophyllum nodosum]